MADHIAASERWAARPKSAALIRVLVYLAPVAASIAFVNVASRVVEMPTSSLWLFLAWLILLSAAATAVLMWGESLSRRLLPLAGLFKLSLIFPDRAPSRFNTAMGKGTTANLAQRVADAKGSSKTPIEAAQQLLRLVADLDTHDKLTRGHSERVRAYAQMIAEELRLGKDDRDLLNWAALLHDVGKIGVPTEILTKPGKPTAEEWQLLRSHPELGEELVAPLRAWLGEWSATVADHHERWDGHGYPRGKAGEEIAFGGRIVAVADVFDVMTSTRSYKSPSTMAEARRELAANAGTQFDERIVRAFLSVSLGRLRLVMGPLAWLTHGSVLGRLPLAPAVTSLTTTLAVVAAAVSTGLISSPEVDAPKPSLLQTAARVHTALPPTRSLPVPQRPAPPPSTQPEGSSLPPPASAAPTSGLVEPAVEWAVDEDTEGVVLLDGMSDRHAVSALRITTPPHAGSAVALQTAGIVYTPPPNYHGRTSLGYEACWTTGPCAFGEVRITVRSVNDLPQAGDDVARTHEDEPALIDVLANDSDADDATLTVSVVSEETDGDASIREGRVAWQPPLNFSGKASFAYTAEDAAGGTTVGNVVVLVAPVNDPPVARLDEVSTDEDVPVTVHVPANDLDPDGDVLEVLAVESPEVGRATHDGGTVRFSPPPDFSGTVRFGYTTTDGRGGRAVGTVKVSVTPVNDPPVAVDDAASVYTGGSVSIDALANDADLEDDALSVAAVGEPASGTVRLEGEQVRFTAPATAGSVSFEYLVRDRDGATDRALVTIAIRQPNSVPSFAAGPDQSVLEDAGPQSVVGWASMVSAGPPDESAQSVSFLSTNTNGTLFAYGGQPAVAADGSLTYTPEVNANGSASVSVKARDDGGTANGGSDTSAVQTFTITVAAVNDSPNAIADSRSVNEDDSTGVTFDVLANDTDPDAGNVLSLSYDDSTVTEGTLTYNGGGLFTFVPAAAFNGSQAFTYTVSDGDGGIDTATVSVAVLPQPDVPLAADDAFATSQDTAVVQGAPGLLVNDGDEDGDPLTVQATPVAPANGSLTLSSDGSFTYTPNTSFVGTDTFTYRVSDGTGRTDDAVVTITIASGLTTTLLYLGTSGLLPDVWDLTNTPQAAASPVPDFDGDGAPGLTISATGAGESETDPRRWHAWVRPVSLQPLVLNGPVVLRLWSSVEGFDSGSALHPHVYLYDCLAGGVACVKIAQNHAQVPNWNGGVPDWVYREITVGSVNRTILIGRELRVRLQTSQHDLWVALTAAHPSALAVTGP